MHAVNSFTQQLFTLFASVHVLFRFVLLISNRKFITCNVMHKNANQSHRRLRYLQPCDQLKWIKDICNCHLGCVTCRGSFSVTLLLISVFIPRAIVLSCQIAGIKKMTTRNTITPCLYLQIDHHIQSINIKMACHRPYFHNLRYLGTSAGEKHSALFCEMMPQFQLFMLLFFLIIIRLQ